MSNDLPDDAPFTTEELTTEQIARLDIEDQIRYAIYNGNYTLGEIVEVSAFSKDWTTDLIEDMVKYDELIKRMPETASPFYMLPKDERPNRGLSKEERAKIHEKARAEYAAESMVGDAEDIKSTVGDMSDDTEETAETEDSDGDEPTTDETSSSSDAYADATTTMSDSTDDDTVEIDGDSHPDTADIEAAMDDHDGKLPVDRDYDWDEYRLDDDDVPDYVSANNEMEDIIAEIETRRETGKLAHFCISGPTGCGKTTLAERIAVEMGPGNKSAPVIEIHCHEGLRPSNILGIPTYVGDETWWIDGPGPKALLSSQEQPTVVILDEVNRTSSRTLGVLMSMLDHQCRLTLDGRGGETVEGNPMNLIVFSTMNEGEGYVVNSVDTAQKRRLGNKYYTDYIGMTSVKREAELIAERTPIDESIASTMVECANEIREKAQSDSAVSMGVPTSTMLDWARTAWAYRDHDTAKGPLVKSAERSVINPFFRGDDREEDTVTTTIESHVEDMEVDPEKVEDGSEMETTSEAVSEKADTIDVSDETFLICEECGWYEKAEDAPEETATLMTCPDCEGNVIPKEST